MNDKTIARGPMPNDPSSIRACWALWMALVALLASVGCAAGVAGMVLP